MKLRLLWLGLLARRWYLGQSTESPPPAGRVATGLRTQAATPSMAPERQREIPAPARPEPDKPLMERAWIELPTPPELPGMVIASLLWRLSSTGLDSVGLWRNAAVTRSN